MSELDVSLDKLRIYLNQFFKFGHRSFEITQQDIDPGLAIDSLEIILIFNLGHCALGKVSEVLADQVSCNSDQDIVLLLVSESDTTETGFGFDLIPVKFVCHVLLL